MRAKRLRSIATSQEWHEARMNEELQGAMRKHGVKSWADLSRVCSGFMSKWEAFPAAIRTHYAFPNPEDRR